MFYRKSRRSEILNKMNSHQNSQKKSIANVKYSNEQILVERCTTCHAALEQYDEETLALCIVCLETFIHREPALAAPLMLEMLCAVTRFVEIKLSKCFHTLFRYD